jgi:hypothetical protein
MPVAVEVFFPGATAEQYDEGIKILGLTPGGKHPGAMFHWATVTDDGIRVVDVWPSKEEFERFAQDQLASLPETLGFSEPEIRYVEVHNYFVGA